MLEGRVRAALAVALVGSLALAQAPIFTVGGRNDPPRPQPLAAGAGDFDGDGHADLWGSDQSSAWIFSGVDHSVLLEIPPLASGVCSGCALRTAGDLDLDGHGDVLTVDAQEIAPGQWRNLVRLLSGRDGSVLGEIPSPNINDYFGMLTSPVGDLDGDGFGDVEIWDSGNSAYTTRVFSGASGGLLHQWVSSSINPHAVGVGDVDADGHADLVVFPGVYGPVSTQIVSGVDLSVLLDVPNPGGVLEFGRLAAPAGDLNQDGHADVVFAGGDNRAFVFSGADGTMLLALSAPPEGPFSFRFLAVLSVDDLDGDGTTDLVALLDPSSCLMDAYSGRSGAQLWRRSGGWSPLSSFERIGDVNADGFDEIAFTMSSYYMGTVLTVFSPVGPAPASYCTAKTNSYGCEPLIHWHGGVSASVGDDFVVYASQILPRRVGALLWSTTPNSTPYGGGTLCVGSGARIVVTPPQRTGPSSGQCDGWLAHSFTKPYLAQHGLGAGATLYAQFHTRDPGFPSPNNVSMTAAITATLVP